MEWYSGSAIDDLLVPRDQELKDRLPSSENWSKWGARGPESFISPNNKCFDVDSNMTEEEFNFNSFCNEVEMENSVQDKQHQSSGSSVCGGSSSESLQRTTALYGPDYQLDHLAGIEQLDDIFLNSLLEDMPGNEDLQDSYCRSPESQYGSMPANNFSTDMTSDSRSNSSDKQSMGSSKYLKTNAFSPSVNWMKEEEAASPFVPCNSEQKDFLSVKVKIQVPSEQNNSYELGGEETSLAESALQELGMVMAQLTDRARIGFRDALYRLAKSSRHVATPSQDCDFTTETQDENMSCEKKQAMESETNTIDRAVANLMFSKMDLDVDVQDYQVEAEIYPKQEVTGEAESSNYCFDDLDSHNFCRSILEGDAEVPTFNQRHQ